ncbi:cytochrome bd-I oxidase subunit CydX [Massilia glaciei]|uniref:Cytochrome bd-I oxidase subunit CydX n=1 Tax=Massilia glaciei TaxID=1524097 RepID=A0A2U2HM10_9BURK|nr:cytochrome bd-I oxidase subunit CydX [Massilia glaciei]PWF48558.1 cytochrome bd-I oxidase subunit CydX [Massilia glaciei]
MWYFTWILGLGFALGAAVINVMWLEANYAFGERDEQTTLDRFIEAGKAGAVPAN